MDFPYDYPLLFGADDIPPTLLAVPLNHLEVELPALGAIAAASRLVSNFAVPYLCG